MDTLLLFPSPPEWLVRLSMQFVEHVAPWTYWLLALTHLAIWSVLNWQKVGGESLAAKWFRRFIFSKACLWLALAVGRTIVPEWRIIIFGLVTLYVLTATLIALWALVVTYVWPVVQYRRGRGPCPLSRKGDTL